MGLTSQHSPRAEEPKEKRLAGRADKHQTVRRTKKECPAPSQPAGMCPDRPHAAHAPAALQPAFSARFLGFGLAFLQASHACNLHSWLYRKESGTTAIKCHQSNAQGASSACKAHQMLRLASPAQTRHGAATWLIQLCGGVWCIKGPQEVEGPPQLCRRTPPAPALLFRHQLHHLQHDCLAWFSKTCCVYVCR